MVEKKKNLSEQQLKIISKSKAKKSKIALVVSEWNEQITGSLLQGATDFLKEHGIPEQNIIIEHVPGSFELPLGAQYFIRYTKIDAVICLGCIIQGETRHFEFISQAVAQSIANVGLTYNTPVIFGVLTTDTMEQALDRAGGKHGNKGIEAAASALKMLALKDNMKDI